LHFKSYQKVNIAAAHGNKEFVLEKFRLWQDN
jgi:hypothetical protein